MLVTALETRHLAFGRRSHKNKSNHLYKMGHSQDQRRILPLPCFGTVRRHSLLQKVQSKLKSLLAQEAVLCVYLTMLQITLQQRRLTYVLSIIELDLIWPQHRGRNKRKERLILI